MYAHHQFLSEQIAELEAERRALLHTAPEASLEKVRQLMQLTGIGINGAWVLVMEFFAWRELKTRREVGGLAGWNADAVSQWREGAGTRYRQVGQPHGAG